MTDATEGESTWARLTRRKVVQWGIAYAAGAWGFLQGLQYVSDAFAWPTQIRQVAILALLVGLPIVTVVAWYHGDRGEQRVTATELATITLLFLLGGGLFWRYAHTGRTSSTASVVTAVPQPAAATDQRPSIAVLPFENRSAKQDDTFFVDGVHDDILTQLTKIGAMKVIARTSVEQFRNTKLTTKEIAEKLGVTRVLEGGVQRAGDRVRVTVQLIDAATDTHLWAESYDRELSAANIFAIQSEVAAAIAAALKTTLTPIEHQNTSDIPTQSLDAWEAYQLGRQRVAKRTSASLAEAEEFFRRAINLDPKFALAYVGLADTLQLQVAYSGVLQATAMTKSEQAVGTALRLDPNLAEAWASSASIAETRHQFVRAETMYRRAIELNPNYATAYQWFSGMLYELGRRDEALSAAERAVELDPLSAIINLNLATYLAAAGHFDEARDRYRKVIEIDPSMPSAYWGLAVLWAYAFNRNGDAIPLGERAAALDPGNPAYPCWVAGRYLDLGDETQATRMVQAAREHWPDARQPLRISGFLHLYRGDLEAAAQDARKLLAGDSRMGLALLLLRDVDLQSGDAEVALARYAIAYPELFAPEPSKIGPSNFAIALDLVPVLQKTGASARANILLDRVESYIQTIPRMGPDGYGWTDVQIYALRGQKRAALLALRAAEKAGHRFGWRYYRDFDPSLASIRNDPEFKAVFADIERDMVRQRADLAARPKDAPLDVATVH